MIDPAYMALIRSDRVSARTRAALLDRLAPDEPGYRPGAVTQDALATLRAVLARVLPQNAIDLGQRLDRSLGAGEGDGWRFASLPPDADAMRAGLAALDAAAHATHGSGFAALTADAQDALLDALAAGRIGPGGLDRWFEDLRGAAVKIYVAHPSTFARMGYSGIGYGGDEPDKPGFHALSAGEPEPWEPVAAGAQL